MVDLRLPVKQNLHLIAKAKGVKVNQLNVMVLDRDRHRPLVEEIRDAGARTKFIMDGDVAGAIAAARAGTGVDALMGIGGTPEGIVAACAIKTLGGVIQGRLWPTSDDEKQKALDAGHDLDRVLSTNDLVTQRQLLLRRHRHHRRRPAQGRALHQGQGPDPVHRDALQVRHHPLRRRRAPGQQVGRLRPPRLIGSGRRRRGRLTPPADSRRLAGTRPAAAGGLRPASAASDVADRNWRAAVPVVGPVAVHRGAGRAVAGQRRIGLGYEF